MNLKESACMRRIKLSKTLYKVPFNSQPKQCRKEWPGMPRIETTTLFVRWRSALKNTSIRPTSSYNAWILAEVRTITRFTLPGTVEREECAASKKSTNKNLPIDQRPSRIFRMQNWRASKIIESTIETSSSCTKCYRLLNTST